MRITKYDVFISYSRRDYTIADKIVNALNAGGFTYFRDQQGIESGSDFLQLIINAIDNSRLFLCVLSENAYSSEFVVNELMYALQKKEDMVLPVIVDNSRLPKGLQTSIGAKNTLNWQFSGNFEIENLIIQDINSALGRQKENMSKIEKERDNIFARNENKCDIFLSYSRKDYDIVRRMKQEIEQATKAKCWMDLEGISYESPDFTKIIAPAIEKASIFIFVLTPNSQESRYARNELLLAKTRNKHIFFVEPRECKMTSEFILEYGHYNKNLYCVDYQRYKLFEELLELLNPNGYYKSEFKHVDDRDLVRFRENEKFGFKDKYTGEVIIPCQWNMADSFHEGLALVMDACWKWGFIDKTGKIVIPCKWESAKSFSNGLANVKDVNGKFGYIDTSGKIVIPCQWTYGDSFHEGFAVVKDANAKYGFINDKGDVVIRCQWEDAAWFKNGLAPVKNAHHKYGFIDIWGKVIIDFRWEYAQPFFEGLAVVKDIFGKYGYIDPVGRAIIPCQWSDASCFVNGAAEVGDNKGNRWKIDKTGKVIGKII